MEVETPEEKVVEEPKPKKPIEKKEIEKTRPFGPNEKHENDLTDSEEC